MLEVFSTREVATGIWLILILLGILIRKNTREGLKKVCKAALTLKLVIPAILILSMGILAAHFASKYSFWDNKYYKDIIMWMVLVGIPLCFGAVSNNDSSYFRNAVVNNLKLTVVFECIFSTFTYSLFAEILIIPIVTFISLLKFIAERQPKYHKVAKLLSIFLTTIGVIMLFFTTKDAIEEFQMDMTSDMLASLVIPLALSFLYVPFAYILALYATYEIAFLRMHFCEPKNQKVRFKHRVKALAICNVSLAKTKVLSKSAGKYMYIKMPEEQYDEYMRKIWRKEKLL